MTTTKTAKSGTVDAPEPVLDAARREIQVGDGVWVRPRASHSFAGCFGIVFELVPGGVVVGVPVPGGMHRDPDPIPGASVVIMDIGRTGPKPEYWP